MRPSLLQPSLLCVRTSNSGTKLFYYLLCHRFAPMLTTFSLVTEWAGLGCIGLQEDSSIHSLRTFTAQHRRSLPYLDLPFKPLASCRPLTTNQLILLTSGKRRYITPSGGVLICSESTPREVLFFSHHRVIPEAPSLG